MNAPRWLLVVRSRLASLLRPAVLDRNLDEELAFHVEKATEAGVARGLSQDEARRRALAALGGPDQRREDCRDARGLRLLQDLWADARYALRAMRRHPAFTAVAVGALALGIGVNTAMFTIVNGVLLRPLPFPQADRLMMMTVAPRPGPMGRAFNGLVEQHFTDFRRGDTLFGAIASFSWGDASLTGGAEPVHLVAGRVTPDFFTVFSVSPALGRSFTAADADTPVAVVSRRLWRDHLGATPTLGDVHVTIDGTDRVVVGVMPDGFTFPFESDVWIPIEIRIDRHNAMARPVVGRLKPGVSTVQAQAELAALTRPEDGWAARIAPLKDLVVGDVTPSLQLLAFAVGFVLLVACANVTNLFLTRASARRHELTVRRALGAGRGRLLRQIVTESLVVSLAGGAAGLLLAWATLPAVLALAPAGTVPRRDMIHVDGWVLLFTAIASVVVGLLCGLVASAVVERRDSPLPVSDRYATAPRERLRGALIMLEVALSLVLLVGAGLMIRSVLRMTSTSVGFDRRNAAVITVELPGSSYKTTAALQSFDDRLLQAFSSIPGVSGVGAVNWLPLASALLRGDVHLDGGRPVPPDYIVDKPAVSAGYFRAMGIRILHGREFTDDDQAGREPVAIVSASVARALWPGTDAVGQRIAVAGEPKPSDWLTVVGVVDDVKQQSLADGTQHAVYQPYRQVTQPFFLTHMSFIVRTSADPSAITPLMHDAFRGVDSNQPFPTVTSLDSVLAGTMAEPTFEAWLLSLFAGLALGLTGVGVYGVLAYAVSQRRRELAIRLALGARPAHVLTLVMRSTLVLAGSGVAVGVLAAVMLATFLKRFLFGVAPTDAPTYVLVSLGIIAVALAAGAVPAWRATRLDPASVLGTE